MTRRGALLGATAAVVAAPARAAAPANSPSGAALYRAARSEGQVRWLSGVLDQSLCNIVCRAFTARYPGIAIEAVKSSSQVAFQQVIDDFRNGTGLCDVFTTTDVGHMRYLAGKQLLLPYTAEAASGMTDALRTFNGGGLFQVSWVGQLVLLYNPRLVTVEDAPKDWPDLTNPRWKDQITFGSPNYSGILGVWAVAMAQRYGWSYFEKIDDLDPLIGRSGGDATRTLAIGERVVAAGIPSCALSAAAKGSPVAVNYPTSGTLVDLSPSAIIARSVRPNAARLLMEFLAGPEYSQILADAYDQPLRPDIAMPAGVRPYADMQAISPTMEEIDTQLPLCKQRWRDIFGT